MTENKITQEELQAVREVRARVASTKIEAEKAVAIAKIAELETTNLILSIYNKYQLRAGIDIIRQEDGVIVRKEEDVITTPDVVETTTEATNG